MLCSGSTFTIPQALREETGSRALGSPAEEGFLGNMFWG